MKRALYECYNSYGDEEKEGERENREKKENHRTTPSNKSLSNVRSTASQSTLAPALYTDSYADSETVAKNGSSSAIELMRRAARRGRRASVSAPAVEADGDEKRLGVGLEAKIGAEERELLVVVVVEGAV